LKKQCVEGCTPQFLTLGALEESEVNYSTSNSNPVNVRTASENK